MGGKEFSTCRNRCLCLRLSPSLLGGREGLLPALRETGEAVEAPQRRVTSLRSPSLLGLPCPQRPLHPQKTRPGPGPHLGGAGWGQRLDVREIPLTCLPVPLSYRALTRLPRSRQDGRYGNASPCLLTAWASVCPSVKGLCFWETCGDGLEVALELPEGPVWGPPASFSGLSGLSHDV